MAENNCQHTKICPIYQGTKEVKTLDLNIYKNVFCNRGLKGWNNCEQYTAYNTEASEKKKEHEQ